MSTISKNLQGFLFNGAALALGSAPFKNNINVLYGFNAAGTGYTSFRPTSNFNSLTQLEQDKAYILDAVPGFELPGASLVAGAAPVAPLTIVSVTSATTDGIATVSVRVNSPSGPEQLLYSIDTSTPTYGAVVSNFDQSFDLDLVANNIVPRVYAITFFSATHPSADITFEIFP